MPRALTRAEARRALGEMPERSFARLVRQGLPRTGDGRAARFPWPGIYHWYLERERRAARDAAKPKDFAEARARKETAEAELAELKLARERDRLMTVEQFEAVVSAAFSRVNTHLRNLERRLTDALELVVDRTERQRIIAAHVDDIRAELRQADDVPAAGPDPDRAPDPDDDDEGD